MNRNFLWPANRDLAKKARVIWLGLIPLLLFGCQLSPSNQAATPTTEGPPDAIVQTYPLAAGAYWVYQGTVTSGEVGNVVDETVKWRVEVIEEISRPPVTGYRMRGSLDDLTFYSSETQPSEYAILQVGSSRFYTADLVAFARMGEESDLLIGLVQDINLILELPLVAGNRFCETEQLTRTDGSYCWMVGAPETLTLGTPDGETVWAYPLYYLTSPDQTMAYFAPGIGVVAFTYHHTGSISDVQMELVEYSLGEAGP